MQNVRAFLAGHGQTAAVALVVVLLLVPPGLILSNALSREGGVLRLLYFGEAFFPRAVPAAHEVAMPLTSKYGYDGQMYAQMAADPLLSEELQEAVPFLEYRARRIGLPILAWLVSGATFGLLTPFHAYALTNFFFYGLLLFALARFLNFANWQSPFTMGAVCLSSGVLISMERALPDLPALAVGLTGLLLLKPGLKRSGLFSFMVLTKEHMVLNALNLLTPADLKPARWKATIPRLLILLLPVLLWYGYVRLAIGPGYQGLQNFTYPAFGLLKHLFLHLQEMSQSDSRTAYLNFIALASIAYQISFLFWKRDYASAIWRFALPSAIIVLFVGNFVWEGHNAYYRVALPLTAGFNLYLYERRLPFATFLIHFALGNFGMFRILGQL